MIELCLIILFFVDTSLWFRCLIFIIACLRLGYKFAKVLCRILEKGDAERDDKR